METIESVTKAIMQVSICIIVVCAAIMMLGLLAGFLLEAFSEDENTKENKGSQENE